MNELKTQSAFYGMKDSFSANWRRSYDGFLYLLPHTQNLIPNSYKTFDNINTIAKEVKPISTVATVYTRSMVFISSPENLAITQK